MRKAVPMLARLAPIAALAAACCVAGEGAAQTRTVSPRDAGAIRACALKYADNVTEGERRCLFTIVADPCSKRTGMTAAGPTECYRIEQEIWDELLNENFSVLRESLGDEQKEKLRDMQRAWIAYRNSTCAFYYDKIQGTMANPMTAACLARETARRALLLKFFERL